MVYAKIPNHIHAYFDVSTSSTAGDATTGHVLCYCPTPHSAGLVLCSFAYSKGPTLSNITSVVHTKYHFASFPTLDGKVP